jgi:hypothetical protein
MVVQNSYNKYYKYIYLDSKFLLNFNGYIIIGFFSQKSLLYPLLNIYVNLGIPSQKSLSNPSSKTNRHYYNMGILLNRSMLELTKMMHESSFCVSNDNFFTSCVLFCLKWKYFLHPSLSFFTSLVHFCTSIALGFSPK